MLHYLDNSTYLGKKEKREWKKRGPKDGEERRDKPI